MFVSRVERGTDAASYSHHFSCGIGNARRVRPRAGRSDLCAERSHAGPRAGRRRKHVVSLGGTWTGTFTHTINGIPSAPQVVTLSLNQRNQAITGTAVFAVASDPTQKVADTVVGVKDGKFVDPHFTSVEAGITQLNYPATITQLDHGSASLTGDVNFINPFQIIGQLTVVRR